jgi:hypothetical protein
MVAERFPPLRQFDLDLGLDRSQPLHQEVDLVGHGRFPIFANAAAGLAHGTADGASHSTGHARAKIPTQRQPRAVNRRKNS